MTRISALLAVLLLVCSPLVVAAAIPTHNWSKGFGGIGEDYVAGVAADNVGNVYITGWFDNSISFGGAAVTPVGGFDIYLAKFDATGQYVWSRRLGGPADETVTNIAVDAAGDVYLAGTFTATTNLGDGNVAGQGGNDVFIVKYSSSGTFQWKHAGGGVNDQYTRSLAVDTAGNVYLAGHFYGAMNMGNGAMVNVGQSDLFIIKYSSTGTFISQQSFGGTGYETMDAINIDAMDNLYVLGIFQNTINFGTGNMTSIGNVNLALAKFNSAGTCQWSRRFGFGSNLEGVGVVIDSALNIYITGHYLCCVDFGGGFMFENGGLYDIFLAKFDASGNHVWSKDFGDGDADYVSAMGIDANDNVYIWGMFKGTVNFGGGQLPEYPQFWTPYLAEFDAFGAHLMSQRFQANFLQPAGLSLKARALYLCGYGGRVDLGGGLLPTVRYTDTYLARFGELPILPAVTSITDVPGDQGRQVSIHFSRSGYDLAGSTAINSYELFRKRDVFEKTAAAPAPGEIALPGWVQVGTVSPVGQQQYVTDAETLVDSTLVRGQHYSKFFVRATTTNPLFYLDSLPDSGYSVDNLPPPAPTGLAFSSGSLSWDASLAADFDYFTVYGSNTTSFGSATLVDYTTDPSMDVTASPYAYYFVTGTDFSGNEGPPASLTAPTGVGLTPRHFALSLSAYPNPFNPQTTIRYTVPAGGRVTIDLFDARGAHVATLFDGVRQAGAFTHAWKGEDDAGHRLSSGVYFARITQAAQTRTYKLVMLK